MGPKHAYQQDNSKESVEVDSQQDEEEPMEVNPPQDKEEPIEVGPLVLDSSRFCLFVF